MTAQKRVMPPDQGGEKPWKNGVVAFVAFVGFSAAPLLSFVILKPFTDNEMVMFVGACFMSAIALTILGIAKAKICGKRNYLRSVGFVLLNGAVADECRREARNTMEQSLETWGRSKLI